MSFPANAYFAAAAVAFAATFFSLPLWRSWALKRNFVDDPGHRKIHDLPIPLAGGLGVATGLLAALALGILAVKAHWLGGATLEPIAHGLGRRLPQISAILAGALGMLVLGYLDDRIELGPAVKFGGQLVIASAVAATGVRITLFVDSVVFSYTITVLWILTLTNAMNFMDNMNGLCGGISAIAAWAFAWTAAIQGQYLVATLAFAVCGAFVGFLPSNYPKATTFLGDSGSHLAGYWLAVLAILPHFYTGLASNRFAVLTPMIVLSVPLLDLAWVVAFRWLAGKPVYIGDNNHLSHQLVRSGLSRSAAVALLWLAGALAGAVSTLLLPS